MELTHGTALATIGTDVSGCRCQCRKDTPAFREDHGSCVNHIDGTVPILVPHSLYRPEYNSVCG